MGSIPTLGTNHIAMNQLTLPSFSYKIRGLPDKPYIFDLLRKQYVRLTPEEWVRQHMINYLIHYRQYPPGLMQSEPTIDTEGHRVDIFVYNSEKAPLMLIECKAANQKLTPLVIAQVMRYNTEQVPFITCTNGKKHFCFQKQKNAEPYVLLREIPTFAHINEWSSYV